MIIIKLRIMIIIIMIVMLMIIIMIIMIITRLNGHDEAQDLVDDLFNDDQEEIVQAPTNIQQEEIVQVPPNIHRVGRILPIAPKERAFYLTMYQRPLPSNRHGFFL